MASAVKFRIRNQREFDSVLEQYRRYSKRDLPTITNTKGYFISRRAVVETPAVPAEEIRKGIWGAGRNGDYAGRIINSRRGQRGEKGLYGDAMEKMILTMRAARLRSRAFLKSGWLWAVKYLAPFAEKRGAPKIDRAAKTYGQAKGSATPARESSFKVRTLIFNTVTALWDTREGAAKKAVPALERAFDFERQSMLAYIEQKQRASAQRAGIKTN